MEQLETKLIDQTLEVMSLDYFFPNSSAWKKFVVDALTVCAPMDFFLIPASSSGKYHQGYELGVGGLVRHTMAAMTVAKTLFPLYHFDLEEQNQIMAALALHDIAKPSKTHPIEAKLVLEPIRDKYYRYLERVIPLIESHHGQWDCFGKLPQAKSTRQQFVHLCDYIASRKNIAIDFQYREES